MNPIFSIFYQKEREVLDSNLGLLVLQHSRAEPALHVCEFQSQSRDTHIHTHHTTAQRSATKISPAAARLAQPARHPSRIHHTHLRSITLFQASSCWPTLTLSHTFPASWPSHSFPHSSYHHNALVAQHSTHAHNTPGTPTPPSWINLGKLADRPTTLSLSLSTHNLHSSVLFGPLPSPVLKHSAVRPTHSPSPIRR